MVNHAVSISAITHNKNSNLFTLLYFCLPDQSVAIFLGGQGGKTFKEMGEISMG